MYQLITIRNDQLIEAIRKVDSACHDFYKNDIKDFLNFTAKEKPLSFPDAIQKYISYLEHKGRAAQTINKRISYFMIVFRFMSCGI
jgi:site-specific recombinase XerD